MGRGSGGSLKNSKRTAGGIRTSSQMSKVGEIEAEDGVLGGDQAPGSPGRVDNSQTKVDWEAQSEKFREKNASYSKDRRVQMETLWNKYVKGVTKEGKKMDMPDVSVMNNDIERWLLQSKREKNRKEKSLKSLEKYNHVELHDAVANYLTASEAKEQKESLAKSGAKLLYDKGGYALYKINKPEALTEFAKNGTHWCTKNPETAKEYTKIWDYTVLTKDDEPLFAIKTPNEDYDERDRVLSGSNDEILYKTDFDVRYGTQYAITEDQNKQYLVKDEYDQLNTALKYLGEKPLDTEYVEVLKDEQEASDVIDDALDDGVIDQSYEDSVFKLASLGRRRISPRQLEKIRKYQHNIHMYIEAFEGKRLPEVEDVIAKDRYSALIYAGGLHSRFPGEHRKEAEDNIKNDPASSLKYAKAYGGRFEPGEEAIVNTENARTLAAYSKATKGRFPGKYRDKAEKIILGALIPLPVSNPFSGDAVGYFAENKKEFSKDEWKEIEAVIANSDQAVDYSRFMKERFPAAEANIAKNIYTALHYMRNLGLSEFPEPYREQVANKIKEGPPELVVNYANVTGKRFPAAEATLAEAKDSRMAARYIEAVGERVEPLEGVISSDPHAVVMYSRILGGRFPEGEKALFQDSTPPTVVDSYFNSLNKSGADVRAVVDNVIESGNPVHAWAFLAIGLKNGDMSGLTSGQRDALSALLKKPPSDGYEARTIDDYSLENPRTAAIYAINSGTFADKYHAERIKSSKDATNYYVSTLKRLGLASEEYIKEFLEKKS